jgi:AraC family transcriptional regulator
MHTAPFADMRFEEPAPNSTSTLLAMQDSVAAIKFTRLCSNASFGGCTVKPTIEKAITVMVALAPSPGGTIRAHGRSTKLQPLLKGHALVFDPQATLVALLDSPYDFLQFSLPVATLDQLSYDRGIQPIERLRTTFHCIQDPTMHALAQSLLPMIEDPARRSGAFIDSIALAFHAHVISDYGSPAAGDYSGRGGLAPVHLRRAIKLIESRLDSDVSIIELAQECRLSASHFSRAFRNSTGVPPHKWIIKRRVERAKELLLESDLKLAEIALACGFFDQSHLTRAFVRQEGFGPGEWRRIRANSEESRASPSSPEPSAKWTRSGLAARTFRLAA